MKTVFLIAIATTTFVAGIAGFAQWQAPNIPPIAQVNFVPVKKTMRPFRSDQDLLNYFKELAAKQKAERQRGMTADGYNAQAPATLAKEPAAKAGADKDDSITNTQHEGVDEGGIVKLHGDHLVVLRRGRLFTVRVGDGSLRPVSAVDAFGPAAIRGPIQER